MSFRTDPLAILLEMAAPEGRQTSTAEAALAAAALVATAASDVSFAERSMVGEAIAAMAEHGFTPMDHAAARFDDHVNAIRANSSQGRKSALAQAAALGPNAGAGADVVLRIAHAIAIADGDIEAAERDSLDEIAAALGREI